MTLKGQIQISRWRLCYSNALNVGTYWGNQADSRGPGILGFLLLVLKPRRYTTNIYYARHSENVINHFENNQGGFAAQGIVVFQPPFRQLNSVTGCL